MIKDSDGNYYIDKSKWESEGELLSATVNVNTFEKNIQLTAANKDIYVGLKVMPILSHQKEESMELQQQVNLQLNIKTKV